MRVVGLFRHSGLDLCCLGSRVSSFNYLDLLDCLKCKSCFVSFL